MEAASLWAGVRFTARNGSPEALLTDAAGQGLHLYGIFSLPGGFYGHCAAWQYRRLAALARHRRVRLRVEKRKGLYFLLRPLLRRKGLWTGLVAWGLVLLWLQGLIWAVDYGSLTTGQRARAGAVLRSCGLQPGTAVTEELLRTGEYALLESGEFSWASLNFEKGRLAVEAAPARARPEIAAGTLHGLRAKCNGTVLRTNLASGTMLVAPGQTVEAGQGLIGTARSERDGTSETRGTRIVSIRPSSTAFSAKETSRFCAAAMAAISPHRPQSMSSGWVSEALPPPEAPPLEPAAVMPMLGWRSTAVASMPRARSASISAIVVVVLPSPRDALSGVSAVTSTTLPCLRGASGLSCRYFINPKASIFLTSPYWLVNSSIVVISR